MNQQATIKATFKTRNYYPNDYLSIHSVDSESIEEWGIFILPHVQEQLKSYFELDNSNDYNALFIKKCIEQFYLNDNNGHLLDDENIANQNTCGAEIIDEVLVCYTLNLKGQSGVFIDDLVWVGQDQLESRVGLYQVNKEESKWIVDKARITEIATEHLYIYEGVLDVEQATKMAADVICDTYYSVLDLKFTLSYNEPTTLEKEEEYRSVDYQKSLVYLISQIQRCPMTKVTNIIAHGFGCVYLNDALKRLSTESLSHLKVLLINPPFPIIEFAARFESAGLKYKDYGFVTALSAYDSKIKGLGMNSYLGSYRMATRYVEPVPNDFKYEGAGSTLFVDMVRTVGRVAVDIFLIFLFGFPLLICWSYLVGYASRKEQEHNPLMSVERATSVTEYKIYKMLKNKVNKVKSIFISSKESV